MHSWCYSMPVATQGLLEERVTLTRLPRYSFMFKYSAVVRLSYPDCGWSDPVFQSSEHLKEDGLVCQQVEEAATATIKY